MIDRNKPKRFSIYIKPSDEQRIQELALNLKKNGVDVFRKNGEINRTKFLMHLVKGALLTIKKS